jgi:hypothetical protein
MPQPFSLLTQNALYMVDMHGLSVLIILKVTVINHVEWMDYVLHLQDEDVDVDLVEVQVDVEMEADAGQANMHFMPQNLPRRLSFQLLKRNTILFN